MNWAEAIKHMTAGRRVCRVSESVREYIGTYEGFPAYLAGTEATQLSEAWDVTGRRVLVFQGADSKVLFKPSAQDVIADDWIVEP